MFDILLLTVYSIFFVVTFIDILRKNILFAGVYLFLFIYNIFAQIGYCFVPELSIFIKAYFGKEYFYKFYFFNFLSFIAFFVVFKKTYPLLIRVKKYKTVQKRNVVNAAIFLTLIGSIGLYMLFFVLKNGASINYNNASDEDFISSQGIGYRVFAMLFKLMATINLVLYTQIRVKDMYSNISYFKKNTLLYITVFYFFLFIYIANKIGSRTDIVALTLGIFIFEYKMGLSLKKILKIALAGTCILFLLLYIEQTRTESSTEDLNFAQKFLLKDYFAPPHMLYTALAYHYVEPVTVMLSNVCNSLILLNYPYLQMYLTDLIIPGLATRSAGFAFYIFTEGYMFMGYMGFIYNALMLMAGLSVWYYLQNSNNKYYNYLILVMMSMQFANIARGQSSYFYKDIYIFFVPAMLIYYLSSGIRPKFSLSWK